MKKILLSIMILFSAYFCYSQTADKPIKFTSYSYTKFRKATDTTPKSETHYKGYTLIFLDFDKRRFRLYPDTSKFVEYNILGLVKKEAKDDFDNSTFSGLDSYGNKCNILLSFYKKKAMMLLISYAIDAISYELTED